eukprot:11205933-Lingulodinium_polyedra.AAC.1
MRLLRVRAPQGQLRRRRQGLPQVQAQRGAQPRHVVRARVPVPRQTVRAGGGPDCFAPGRHHSRHGRGV